jgi:hypothetical protein
LGIDVPTTPSADRLDPLRVEYHSGQLPASNPTK